MSGIVGALLAVPCSDVTEPIKGGASTAPADVTARWKPNSGRFDSIGHGHFDLGNWEHFLYHFCASEGKNLHAPTYWTASIAYGVGGLHSRPWDSLRKPAYTVGRLESPPTPDFGLLARGRNMPRTAQNAKLGENQNMPS